ncbi:ABC transporter permease [Clostridium sporogenes]|uniref:ABC transporter permease n=1 Tax=Clostridium TaxID=1485 RepID=UPI00223902CE|nr:ABC transporter permease [Clostridium sporogenes]MCW6074843.1 ABC transporter permease [Clostridium sporogenes]
MDIFISELKRQMGKRRFIYYLLTSIILGALWSWFIIGGRTEGFMMTDCYKGLKGMKAIKTAAKDRNVYSGKMTLDNFQKSGEVFLKSKDKEGKIIMNDDLLKLAVYADTLVTQNYKLKKISGGDIYQCEKFPLNFGSHFYENENLCYENLIATKTKNQAEKDLAHKMWNKVEKPYTYYGGYETWRDSADHIQLFTFVLLIIICFFSSGIIAQDKECGLDEIISSTKGGRRKLLFAKLFIPIIMGTFMYVFGMGTYMGILNHYLPANALKTSAQLSTTILPYKLGDVMQKMIVVGLIGTLTFCSFTIFISSKVKKKSIAMSISVLVIVSGFLLYVGMGLNNLNNPILEAIKIVLPGSAVFSFCEFDIPVASIFGKAFLYFKLSSVISLLVLFISLIIGSWNYVRR